jgi:hypothetical protein
MNILHTAKTEFKIAALCIILPLFFIFIGALNLLLDFLEDGASEPKQRQREELQPVTDEAKAA